MLSGDFGRRFFNVRKSGEWFPDKDTLVFLFFLLLAFFFWFLNGLGKEVETVVRYPVRYVNPPRDQVFHGDLPSRLEFTVKGPGYSVTKLRLLGSRVPVVIDVSRVGYMIQHTSSTESGYLLSDPLRETFKRQLRADFDILDISPDTLFFRFDKIVSKRVPIMPDLNISVDPQFLLRGYPTANPDSVTVTGPQQIVDTLAFIRTEKKTLSGIDRNRKINVNLENHRELSLSVRRSEVSISVEQLTEARLELTLEIINHQEGVQVRLFPQTATINLLVAVSDYQRISEANIRAIIDLSDIDLRTASKLPVVITNLPQWVQAMRYAPREVDFLIDNPAR